MKKRTITSKLKVQESNITANWLALLLCIQEVLGSASILIEVFYGFSHPF
jgi:hypothetical protein